MRPAGWPRAKHPIIVTADLGRYVGGPEALVRLSQLAGIGVIEHGKRNFFNFPTEHPHHLGFDPAADIESAGSGDRRRVSGPVDPRRPARPGPAGHRYRRRPLFGDLPMRGFPSDLSLAGDQPRPCGRWPTRSADRP
ncbi:MAG: hypothetical protein IPO88_15210 [Nannocystis sp.]|uniref:hypothetical protein n=1 Tax=Nannocystis sp. TaxID=1962667 RepID=UPI002424A2DF|nr:hypothetical protein [Nannocystis sp.]MBK9754819.1 hypothetical protein [Nannocystis sp.]